MEQITSLIAKRRVFLSWVFGICFLVFANPPGYVPSKDALLYLIIGLEIALIGECLRIWASGYLYKGQSLAVNGPFSYTRNPLYLGSFLIGAGFCFATGRLSLFIVFLIFFVMIFLSTIRREENTLWEQYGAEFQNYREKVPVFIPSLTSYNSPVFNRFSWKQVKENKEHLAVIGVLIVTLYMIIRFYLQYNAAAPYNKILG